MFERSRQVVIDRHRPYHDRLGEVIAMLQRDRSISCLLVDLTRLRRVELDLGIAHHTEMYDCAAKILESMRGSVLLETDLICRTGDGDGYLVFLSPRQSSYDLDQMAQSVESAVETALAPAARELLKEQPRITVGSARVLGNSMLRPERLITRLITDAGTSARIARDRAALRHKVSLQDIILGDGLTSVYQPIVDLRTGDVFGYEALTRGPKNTLMESPVTLFGVADEVDLTFELDRACFRGALRNAIGLEPVHRLFVNLLPMSFYDASFIELEVSHLLSAAGLTPANIVFEITEKLAIENFASFRRALSIYSAMGFGVAIDDVGTRHSNLETVMALRPNFIKISDVLVKGIARSPVKREMMRSLGRIAEAVDAVVVAEGIETPDDLAALRELGLPYGQGFFMARPGPPFPDLLPGVRETIAEISISTVARPSRSTLEPMTPTAYDDGDAELDVDELDAVPTPAVLPTVGDPVSAAGSFPEMTIPDVFRDDEVTGDFDQFALQAMKPTGLGAGTHSQVSTASFHNGSHGVEDRPNGHNGRDWRPLEGASNEGFALQEPSLLETLQSEQSDSRSEVDTAAVPHHDSLV
jgi:EAL domain-containing protein (putative c-di-GMP-specific phosphodiesterase class I)